MSRIEGCPHITLIMARYKDAKQGEVNGGIWSDKDIRGYICMHCGFPMLAAPMRKFKNNIQAYELFEEMQKEMQLELPSVGATLPKDQPPDATCSPAQ